MNTVELAQGKPLPVVTDLTRPFWAAAKQHRLVLQKCPRCGGFSFHPRPWCMDCGCRGLIWTDAKPTGTVYAHTVCHTVAMNFPGWAGELPLLMCLVDLDDGVRMYAQVTDCPPERMRIGLRVQVHFRDLNDEIAVPAFRPVSS